MLSLRGALCVGGLAFAACGAARQRQAEEYLRNELSFLRPYVDIDAEDKATRNALGRRDLMIEEEARGQGFSALSAASADQRRSAVRIITRRGVMVAEDADLDDWFALANVRLATVAAQNAIPETLVGIVKTARGNDAGCLTLFRVTADGRLIAVEMRVDRFGSRVCVHALEATAPGTFIATLIWPSLSAGVAPELRVELRVVAPRLDRPVEEGLVLRVSDDSDWITQSTAALAATSRQTGFPSRQARAVAQAALALARSEGAAQQLGAYRSTLGGAAPGTPEADVMAATVAHIEHGWSDVEPGRDEPAPAADSALPGDPPLDPDAIVIEPEAPSHE